MPAAHDVALIERHIEPDPTCRSKADAQLRESGASVWAIIGYLRRVGDDTARAARYYDVPVEAIEAARAYYRQHQTVIDGRLEDNEF